MMNKGEAVNKKMNEMFDDIKGLCDKENWTAKKLCGACTSLACVGFFAILTIALAAYGFSNPDPTACWVVKGIESAALTRDAMEQKAEDMGKPVPEGYPVEMHSVYVNWALWGFWQNFLFFSVFIASTILMFLNCLPMTAMVTSTLTSFAWIVGTVCWLVLGLVWRFSSAGQISSGDRLIRPDGQSSDDWKAALKASSDANGYQIKSGAFMGNVAGAFGLLIFGFIVAFAILGCCMCCCGMEKMPEMPEANFGLDKADKPAPYEPVNE